MSETGDNRALRRAIKLESVEPEKSPQPKKLKPRAVLTEAEFVETAENQSTEPSAEQQLIQRGKGWVWGFWLGVSLFVLGGIEVGLSWYEAWQQMDLLALAWLALLCVVLVLCGVGLYREWRLVASLDRAEVFRQTALGLSQSPAIGEGRAFCQQVADQLPKKALPVNWSLALQEHHSDKEVLVLFEQQVLSAIDKEALKEIRKESGACAMMIAVSPFVLVDMALVMWRNLRLIRKISQCYGLSMGYWSRVVLLKRMCRIMLYAGATELMADGTGWLLGNSLTSKFSGQLAQGLGAGVLTARLGLQAMSLCRPMPFLANPKPTLGKLASEIGTRLQAVEEKK
ncbi:TIGR01620 family protein [Aliiglaciecola sp. CAU 1673]|uniref:TIGR01620 family protein n=1 Tax=Aliiglaciecola sp. CAU 1673 TaxID=3032595 RepID=UPI0023DA92C3|nr:TIGR01620 family protein [Aliiglaciecola sp. CAU 1673]MDF2179579.1 TIGR01620 family protein [Aliiglaciecola sp. CAU 1673]